MSPDATPLPHRRPRRNRRSDALRRLSRETHVRVDDLIQPVFVIDGDNVRESIPSMPGIERLSLDLVVALAIKAEGLGIPGIALFPALPDSQKDRLATSSTDREGLLLRTVRAIKAATPGVAIITDVAMDPYSSDGHDGLLTDDGLIDNDATLPILAAMAVAQAQSGADIVAPSDMMDGRVEAIRTALDSAGYTDVAILAYSAKYASAFYGPFRDALDSAPRAGDKKTYQMDPANRLEALTEVGLDIDEGADMVMVKPGLAYLDILREVRDTVTVPVAVYHVSGEYAMLKAAAAQGWIDGDAILDETLLAFKRAGANMILTYAAIEWAERHASNKEAAQ